MFRILYQKLGGSRSVGVKTLLVGCPKLSRIASQSRVITGGAVLWHFNQEQTASEFQTKEKENMERFFSDFSGVVESLYRELVDVENRKAEECSAPIRARGYEYRISADKLPRIYRRSILGDESPPAEEVVLDLAHVLKLGENDGIYLNQMKLSFCGNQILFSVLNSRRDSSKVYIKKLSQDTLFYQPAMDGAFCIEWSQTGKLFFTKTDRLGRPHRVYVTDPVYHSVMSQDQMTEIVFQESDAKHFLALQRTKDWKYVCINSHSKICSEVYLIDETKNCNVISIRGREPKVEYFVEHCEDNTLIILSNLQSRAEYELFYAKIQRKGCDSLQVSDWKICLHSRVNDCIEDLTVNEAACTLLRRQNNRQYLEVIPRKASRLCFEESYFVSFPEWVKSASFGPNEDFDGDEVELHVASPVRQTEASLQLASSSLTVSQVDDADSMKYKIQDIWCPSHDGVQIPVTFMSRYDKESTKQPCLLVSYGAYGENLPLGYQPHLKVLMNRGWNLAFLHIRGGGELGRNWHEQGRGDKKLNSSRDIHACIEYMLDKGWIHHGKIACHTNSAGAVALGGFINTHGHLVRAVIMESPFVDVFNVLSDPNLPLTEHEHDEFGNPNTAFGKHLVHAVCPLSGLQAQQVYPSMLICTGEFDHQVPFQGIMKYVKKMRHYNNDKSRLILWPAAYKGHLPDDSELITVRAMQFAFLENAMKQKDVYWNG